MRLAPFALALLVACTGAPPQAPPSHDIHAYASRELLRKANHGREVEGPDGRFVLPPSVRRVWIDVGAHLLETTRAEMEGHDDIAVVAIEPLEECWTTWPDTPRLIAMPVAISLERGFMDFNVNVENGTSSLLPSVAGNSADKLTKTLRVIKVPVLRLEDVLERIPAGIDVEYVKTDVQGQDLQVLKSAGDQIRRAGRVQAEVINERIYDGKGEMRPGTEPEFVAYMDGKGFRFTKDSNVGTDRRWLDKTFVNSARR